MQDIGGKLAWVTGAGSGIGRATARALADAGADVIVSGRRRAALGETAEQVSRAGGEALVLDLDVTDAGAVQRAVAEISERWGRLDILVNNAGANVAERHWADLDRETWDHLLAVNLNGAFYCVWAALPVMREHGDGLIVNVSSWAGRYDSVVSGAAYSAAKRGMLAMNESLNREEGGNGIRACAICPGEVATPILDHRPVPVSAEDRARMLQPEDVAATIVFVARMPSHVCFNEIVISPTWNRAYFRESAQQTAPAGESDQR